MRKTTPLHPITRTIDTFSRRAILASRLYGEMMDLKCGIAGVELAIKRSVYQSSAADLAIASGLATGLTKQEPVTLSCIRGVLKPAANTSSPLRLA